MKTTVAALACVLATAIAGCADNRATVEIAAVCAPPDDSQKCAESGKCSLYLASDRPWVYTTAGGFLNRLEMFIEIDNQMPNNANGNTGRVNTNDFIHDEYLFSYTGISGLADVRYPANFTVFAGSSFSPVVPLIPETTMAAIIGRVPAGGLATLNVEMKARGHLLDGTTVETGPFDVAVDVYNADFAGYAPCSSATDVRFVCPNVGQTASTKCATP